MTTDFTLLLWTAAGIGFVHTLAGPDHYLPFIMLGRTRNWHVSKTVFVTVICGIGHVVSSALLGLVGIGLGVATSKMSMIQVVRGNIAAWAMLAVGTGYFAWGIYRAYKGRKHTHIHVHVKGDIHRHKHVHEHESGHGHQHGENGTKILPVTLFILFVLGPCELLIPLLIIPAANMSWSAMLAVIGLFGVTTLVAMAGAVTIGSLGLKQLEGSWLGRYGDAITGGTIAISAVAIIWLGV